ncbi:hypothetical protein VNI00_012950 [Paramarasmius palmivorus]|uniref:Uncharacterized protein n=1 Tax=Paramarasmius palmivorus TaxID=297713 RepID=A0AAW0C1I7_9AGAR
MDLNFFGQMMSQPVSREELALAFDLSPDADFLNSLFDTSDPALHSPQPSYESSQRARPSQPQLSTPSSSGGSLPPPSSSPSTASSNSSPPQNATQPKAATPVKDKAPTKGRAPNVKVTPVALEQLVRLVNDKNPYTAGHGEKGKGWESVREKLNAMGHMQGVTAAALRKRVDDMLKAHKDGKSFDTTRGMTKRVKINTASLLDKIGREKEVCESQTEQEREAHKQIVAENTAGGMSIRQQAMQTRPGKRNAHQVESDQDDSSDEENTTPSSSQTSSSEPPKKKAKLARSGSNLSDISSQFNQQIKSLEKKVEESKEQVAEMIKTSKQSLEAYKNAQDRYAKILAKGMGVEEDNE